VRHIYLSLFFCCNFAANASACVANVEFIRESNSETLVACLEGPEGEVFLTERSLELATVLHLAVETEKDRLVLDAIRRAAGEGWPDLRDRLDADGRTALHIATETGEPTDTVHWLLNWGADPNALYSLENRWNPLFSDYGITPLHLAAMRADGSNVVSALLASGADPAIARPIETNDGQKYWPAVLVASRHAEDLRVLTAMAAGGADLNVLSYDDNNALHLATAWDRPSSVIRFLYESGVDANKTNHEGQTPLHLAARFSSNPETVALLLEATDAPCAADTKERTARELLRVNGALSGDHGLERRFHEICVEGN
jgi:ankyrin repeat protein